MTRDDFLARGGALVGEGKGVLARIARLLGVAPSTVRGVSQGQRPVSADMERRLREAEAQAARQGRCVPYMAPRLERLVREAEAAGWSRGEAEAAGAAWFAVRVVGARRPRGGRVVVVR